MFLPRLKVAWLAAAALVASLKVLSSRRARTSQIAGLLAAHSIPSSLYAGNEASKLEASLVAALRGGVRAPPHLRDACAATRPSFNALILERMARDRRDVLAALTDKALVRTWAAARNASTPDLLLASRTCDADFGSLRGDYAFKATHTTGCLVLVEGGRIAGHKPCGEARLAPGKRADADLLAALCARWTSRMYDVTQWAYGRLEPGVIAERLVYDARGRRADDVKCYAFHGSTALVHHVTARFDEASGRPRGASKRDTFYDATTGLPRAGVTVDGSRPLPRRSSRLLAPGAIREAARVCDGLARGLDFARVDLFAAAGGLFRVGELTMYPKRGGHAFQPRALDEELGRAWCRAA